MLTRQGLLALWLATCGVLFGGCSSYYKDINDVTGVTEEELKKSMEGAGGEGPNVVQTTAEETMGLLLDPEVGSSAADVLKASKRRLIGTVLETSPKESETQFVILDGGTHQNQACKVKCILAKGQNEALEETKVGDEVRITGSSDAVVAGGVLEMKECVFDAAASSAAASKR